MPCRRIVVLGPESTGKSTLCEGLAAHFRQFRSTAWVPEYAREYLETHGMNYRFEDLLLIARGQLNLEDRAAEELSAGAGEAGGQAVVGEQASGLSEGSDAERVQPGAVAAATVQPEGFDAERGQPGGGTAARMQSGEGTAVGLQSAETILFIDTDMYVMKVWGEFVFGGCDTWILDQIAARHYDGYLLCAPDLPWTYDVLREYPDNGPREELFHIYKDCMINQSTPWDLVTGQHEERLRSAIVSVNKMLGSLRLQH